MWRSLMRTTPACVETWKDARRPSPMTNSVEPPPMSMTTSASSPSARPLVAPEERQRGLLVAGQRAGVEPVVVAHARGELRAVGGVANRAREHGEVALDAVLGDHLPVGLEHGEDALHRRLGKRAGRVDALAQAGDLRGADELGDGAIRPHLGDEQPGRIGADVDHGDAHAGHRSRGAGGAPARGARQRLR